MGEITKKIGLSLGADLCWPVCYEEILKRLDLKLPIGDLSAITPDAYLEVGGAVLHPLSYQVARNRAVPVAGLFLAASGYMFSRADVPRGVLITAVGGRPVTDLRGLEAAVDPGPIDLDPVCGQDDGARQGIRFEWHQFFNRITPQEARVIAR